MGNRVYGPACLLIQADRLASSPGKWRNPYARLPERRAEARKRAGTPGRLKETFRLFAFVNVALHGPAYDVKAMRNLELADRIRYHMDSLTPRERVLAKYLLDNLEQVPLLNSAQLASEAGLSSATVTRFSQSIGYKGFVELRASLRSDLRRTYQPSGPEDAESFLGEFWKTEVENTVEAAKIPDDAINRLVDALADANAVWLGGVQTMRPVVFATKYFLGLFRPRTYALVEDVRIRPEELLDMTSDDVAVLFTVRRYAKATTRLGEAIVAKGATLFLVTDDGAPPLARMAHHTIRLPTKAASPMRSVTAFIQLAQLVGLLVGAKCGNARNEAAEELFNRYAPFEY